jgi:hypothetical protein
MNESIIIQDLLGPLSTLLKRGEVAYENYMSNKKAFLYAIIIKDNNMRIRELILRYSHLLPHTQQSNAIELVAHIDIWSILWNDLNESKSHLLDDEFTFENSSTFPKKSVESLLGYYQELKIKINA